MVIVATVLQQQRRGKMESTLSTPTLLSWSMTMMRSCTTRRKTMNQEAYQQIP